MEARCHRVAPAASEHCRDVCVVTLTDKLKMFPNHRYVNRKPYAKKAIGDIADDLEMSEHGKPEVI